MILSKPLSGAMRGVGRNALDLPVAAFAAVAVAFLAFAMPSDLLTELVGASGLPAILPAAEPPLGYKARIGVGIIGAALVFGLVLMLLRFLDRTGYDPAEAETQRPEVGRERPRARRRDAHPDAPAPWPISAAREFGEPTPPVAPPAPVWLDTTEPAAEIAPEPEAEIALEPEAALAPEPEAAFAPEPEAIPAPEPEPVSRAEPSASLPELMARLEEGLQRRRVGPGPAPSAPAPQVFPEANDDRLQSAIDSLQRLAARHN